MTSWAHPEDVVWLGGTIMAILLLASVLTAWTRQRAAIRGKAIAGIVCALVGGALVWLLVEPADVPTGWITVLQEGRSARNVRQLYGSATHAGGGFFAMVDWLNADGPTALPAIVRANVGLGVVDTVVLLFLASHVLRSWWGGVAFAAAYACNPNTINAAFSETPAMLWTLHVWLACIAAAVVADGAATRRVRWRALACFATLMALAAWIRGEALVLGVPALVVGLVHVAGAQQPLQAAVRSAGRRLRTIVAGPRAVFLLASAALLALEYVPTPDGWRYPLAALRPLNFSFLTWLQTITLCFPFAIVVLFALGTIHGVRRWLDSFVLPISVLVLLKIYASASHGAFLDKFRYLTFVTPLVLFVALFGFRELSAWAQRLSWPAWWKRVAILLLVATIPAWNPWQRELYGRRQELPGVSTPETFLARNQQTEVRYLLDLLHRYPRCTFLAKTPRAESASDTGTGSRWMAFGASARGLSQKEDAAGGVERTANELAPEAPCVLFYRSLDCDLVGYDGCAPETEGREPLEQRLLENLPYSEIYEYGAHRAEIRLGVYPVVVRDPSALAAATDAAH